MGEKRSNGGSRRPRLFRLTQIKSRIINAFLTKEIARRPRRGRRKTRKLEHSTSAKNDNDRKKKSKRREGGERKRIR